MAPDEGQLTLILTLALTLTTDPNPNPNPSPEPNPSPNPTPKQANATFHGVTLQQLYYDRIHPSDLGHTVLALALTHLFKRAALLAAALAEPHAAGTAAAAAAAVPRGCAAVPAQLLSPMDKTVDPASTALECFDAPVLGRLVDQPCRSRAQKGGPRSGQGPHARDRRRSAPVLALLALLAGTGHGPGLQS